MKLVIPAVAVAAGIVCGVSFLLVGLADLAWGYGGTYLDVMESLYPGYDHTPSIGEIIVGTIYSIVHGILWGGCFAWLYCILAPKKNKYWPGFKKYDY